MKCLIDQKEPRKSQKTIEIENAAHEDDVDHNEIFNSSVVNVSIVHLLYPF